MQPLFQLLTDEDVRKDEAAILRKLSALMAEKRLNEVKLVNYYKEVPITSGASIESIDGGIVELSTHRTQAAAMLKQKLTFIKSPHFSHDVTAKVERILIDKKRVFLSQFSFVSIRAARRKFARVMISGKHEVSFRCGKVMVTGIIRDISIGGVAVLAPKGTIFPNNAKGTVSLSVLDTKVFVPGKLLRLDDDNGANVYVFEMEMDAKNEKLITKYIYQRQRDILNELEEVLR